MLLQYILNCKVNLRSRLRIIGIQISVSTLKVMLIAFAKSSASEAPAATALTLTLYTIEYTLYRTMDSTSVHCHVPVLVGSEHRH